MKRIAFIFVYMGKFPDYFLWLESCKYNESIDFIIFTDDQEDYCYPPNVHVNYMTFDKLKMMIQEHFDFPIKILRAYKLCDFKPDYGEIFKDFLKEYDFWGHCDIDLIWGNIRHFITDELMENNVRIYPHGHCRLYKNAIEVNSMYRTLSAEGYLTYKEVFVDETNMAFDEWSGITAVMKLNYIPIFYRRDYADLNWNNGNCIEEEFYLLVLGIVKIKRRKNNFGRELKKLRTENNFYKLFVKCF